MTGAILVPGSYDPVTAGHLAIIEQAAKMADTVYAAIFVNPDKHYRFPLPLRLRLLRQATAHLPNVKVVSDGGRVVDFAAEHGVSLLVKGVRNEADFLYERKMADYNRAFGVETLLLPSPPHLREVSSSALRAALDRGEPLLPYLPSGVAALLEKALASGEGIDAKP